MSMAPLQCRAIHWTTQDIIGLHCIRFSPVCILKVMVSGSPLLLLLLESDRDCLLRPNPGHGYPTKMNQRDRALKFNPNLSAFFHPQTSSQLSELFCRSWTPETHLNQANFLCYWNWSCLPWLWISLQWFIRNSHSWSHRTRPAPLLSESEVRYLALNWHCLPSFTGLSRGLKCQNNDI